MSQLYLYIILSCAVISLYNNNNYVSAEDICEVSISLGKIKGSFMQTRLRKRIYSYRGIRYAEPPVGEKPFKVRL